MPFHKKLFRRVKRKARKIFRPRREDITRRRRRLREVGRVIKRRAERVDIIPGVRGRIPLGVKATIASFAIPGLPVARVAGAGLRAAPRFLRGVGRFIAPRTPKQAIGLFLGVPTAAGILIASPKARRFLDPRRLFKKGKALGGLIEDPSQLRPSVEDPFGKIKEFGAAAGLVGAGAAAAVAIPALITRFRERRAAIPSAALPTGIIPSGVSLTPRTQPLGAAEKEVPEITEVPVLPSMPDIKITNKPEINISFRKSRRFINQQVLIK